MLRKPEDLVVSLYYEMFKSDDEADVKIVKEFANLENFSNQVKNVQTFILSGLSQYREMAVAENAAYRLAIKSIDEHFMYIGNLENYKYSVNRLFNIIGWPTPKNNQILKKGTYNKSGITKSFKALLKQNNQLDTELYNYALNKYNPSSMLSRFISKVF